MWIRRLFPPLATLNAGPVRAGFPVSIAILTRDEERCIARCLDSVVGRGFDRILVVDTGSVDATRRIVDGYRQHGVQLIESPWSNSFAATRNVAIETAETGWVVFLDADEWLTEHNSERLGRCLSSLSGIEDLAHLAFTPIIHHVDRDEFTEDVPRILMADSGIRFRGPVHEYPVVPGPTDQPVGLVGLDIQFRHDGYDRAVATSKNKRKRNLALLRAARESDPDNPRWWYFTIRDGLPTLDRTEIVDLCATLRRLVEHNMATGDRRDAREYYRLALGAACQGLAGMGDWRTVHRYCDELDRVDGRDSPDAHYFRTVAELRHGAVTDRDLLRTIRVRRDDESVSASVVDPAGRHLDALVAALLARCRGAAQADRYLQLCAPWTDTFFERSKPRQPIS
jgi:glycosyltransferase involved in cell wall biosynthesis